MEIKAKDLITHPSLIDINAYVLDILQEDRDSIQLDIVWCNKRFDSIFGADIITIKKQDLKKWYKV